MSDLPPALATAVAAQEDRVSPARLRQLRWVAGEMSEAVAHVDPASRPSSAVSWFSPPFVEAYLALADAGHLRRRGGAGRPGNASSARVRRVCLRLLAGANESRMPPLPLPAVELPRERALPYAVDAAVGRLLTRASSPSAPAGLVRAAALTALASDTGMRVGELAALVVDDVDLNRRTVTWVPRPQARRARESEPPTTSPLQARTAAALRVWLEVRRELTVLVPRSRALFVSVAGNHDGAGVRRPAGLPLRARGMQRAHDRAVVMLNGELTGTEGYPIPRVLGSLRRAETATATEAAERTTERGR
ncbi:MAG: tyrosine-type recombinase/integrase [Actinomycetes bacterium]